MKLKFNDEVKKIYIEFSNKKRENVICFVKIRLLETEE